MSRRETFDRLMPQIAGRSRAQSILFTVEHLSAIADCDTKELCFDAEKFGEACLRLIDIYEPDLIVIHGDDFIEAEALGVELNWQGKNPPLPVTFPNLQDSKALTGTGLGRYENLLQSADWIRKKIGTTPQIFLTLRDPFSLAALTTGIENFLILLIQDPVQIREWIEHTASFQERIATRAREAGFQMILGSPIACCGIINREHFLMYVLPNLQRLLDIAGSCGGFRALHWCGRFKAFNDLLPGLNLDLLSFENIDEVYWGDMPDTIPMGGINSGDIGSMDEFNLRESVVNATSKIPRPYILAPSCFIPAGTHPHKLTTLFQSIR